MGTVVAETAVVNKSSLVTKAEVVESPAPVVVTAAVMEPAVETLVEQGAASVVVKPAAVESSAPAVVETVAKETAPLANLQSPTPQVVLRPPLPTVQMAGPRGMPKGPLVHPGQIPLGSSTRPMRPVASGNIAQVRTCMPQSMTQPMVNTLTGSVRPPLTPGGGNTPIIPGLQVQGVRPPMQPNVDPGVHLR